MAVIKSGASTDQWTIDATSKAGRVTGYNSAGGEQSWATAANLTTTDQTLGPKIQGVIQMAGWSSTNFPSTATQATVARNSNASGRHVLTAFHVSFSTVATTSATLIRWVIRDGATGAGTILWQGTMNQGVANTNYAEGMTGLALIGSTNTAMTIEFTAAGTTGSQQAVNMQGFDTA